RVGTLAGTSPCPLWPRHGGSSSSNRCGARAAAHKRVGALGHLGEGVSWLGSRELL
ncbi:hypothetical protein GGF41_002488, partial [Coemansia sp. RSA 2531]